MHSVAISNLRKETERIAYFKVHKEKHSCRLRNPTIENDDVDNRIVTENHVRFCKQSSGLILHFER